MQIEREIFRQDLFLEDVGQQPFVALAEDDVVVGEIGVGVPFFSAKVDDKQRHAVFGELFVACVGVAQAARFGGDHVQVGPGYVGVGDDVIGFVDGSIGQTDAGGGTAVYQYLLYLSIQVELAAQLFNQSGHCRHQRARAALRIMYAPFPFQVMDHGVDRRRIKRIAANQQRVEGKNAAQKIVFHEAGGVLVDRFMRLQLDEVRGDAQHIADGQKWFVGQLHKAFLEDGFGSRHKAMVAGHIGRVPFGDFAGDEVRVVVVVEGTPFVVKDAVERVELNKVDIIFAAAAGQRKNIVEHKRRGDNCGAAVEFEAVFLEHVGAAADFV